MSAVCRTCGQDVPWTLVPVLSFTFELKTVSELNLNEHYRVKQERVKREKHTAKVATLQALNLRPLPRGQLDMKFTRIAPRALDGHDNLGSSLKHVIDAVARALGYANDNDPLLDIHTAQEKGAPKFRAVRVEIARREG